MPESARQKLLQDALNREIDCRFIAEIETPGDNEIRCGLKYLDYYDIIDWGIVVLVNNGRQVSYEGDGRIEVLYMPDEIGTDKISLEWFTVNELSERQAKQFNIPEEIRELLNDGLALFREYDLGPETREIDRDYANERFNLDERKERLQRSREGGPSSSGDELTQSEIEQEMEELEQIESEYRELKGRRVVRARPLEYFFGGLEALLDMAENGEIPEERYRG